MRSTFIALFLLLSACDADPELPDAGPDAGALDVDAGAIGETVDPSTLGLAEDPPGEWLAGDLHVHSTGASNDTGGDSTPEDIARIAQERGLFFVVLTDHSNSTGSDTTTTEEDEALFNMGPEFPWWDRAAELSEPGVFLMIDGNEISPVAPGERPTVPTGHVGCIPADLETFDRSGAFTDRPRGTVTGADVLGQATARGCFTVINHPWGAVWTGYDWTSFDYDALEVWNGSAGLDSGDRDGHAAWRCDLLQGRGTTAIGASDNHRVNQAPPGEPLHPALGFPSTHVFAAERTWAAIVEGLRAGRTSLGEGGSFVQVDGYAADGAASDGGASGAAWLRARGMLGSERGAATLVVTRATSCVDTRETDGAPVTLTEEVILRRSVEAGASFDFALAIGGTSGVYTAELSSARGHNGALSGALVLD